MNGEQGGKARRLQDKRDRDHLVVHFFFEYYFDLHLFSTLNIAFMVCALALLLVVLYLIHSAYSTLDYWIRCRSKGR